MALIHRNNLLTRILVLIDTCIFFWPSIWINIHTFAKVNFSWDIFAFETVKDIFLIWSLGLIYLIGSFIMIEVPPVHKGMQTLTPFMKTYLPFGVTLLGKGFFREWDFFLGTLGSFELVRFAVDLIDIAIVFIKIVVRFKHDFMKNGSKNTCFYKVRK